MKSFLLLAAVLIATCYPADAYWNCWGCINSVTVFAQAHTSRYSGTDNEGPPHYVNLEFFCKGRLTTVEMPSASPPAEGSGVGAPPETGPGSALTFPNGRTVSMDYTAINATVNMSGIIMKGNTRTYHAIIPKSIRAACKCVRPVDLKRAWALAGNSDGFRLRSLTTIAHFIDRQRSAGLLTLNRRFGKDNQEGWLDTTAFPRDDVSLYVKLDKAGC